jgi:hypothetical protein
MSFRTLLVPTACLVAAPVFAQFQAPQPSSSATLTQRIGLTDVSISYSRPNVKGRAIWGGLVPWDKPWRTGANQATTVTFSDEVTVQGQKLAAGTYALVTVPGKDEWTVIFNKDTKLWFETEYDAAKDVLRVKAKPVAADMTESLTLRFLTVEPASAVLAIEWEKLRVPVTVGVEIDGKVRKAVAAAKADDWQTPLGAARYFFDQKKHREEAWQWLEKSIGINRNFSNLARKARVLAEEGKLAEAVKAGEESLALAKADPSKPNMAAFEKTVGEWKAKAK